MTHYHRYRVTFRDGTTRDVSATSAESALVVGRRAQKLVGYKRKDETTAVKAVDLGHHGTGEEWCPTCRAKTAKQPA